MEVEEMINKVREEQGRPFDVTQLTASCMANVIMNMLFGHRFDHSDSAFQQLISDFHKAAAIYPVAVDIFPTLRFLPYFKKKIAECFSGEEHRRTFINNAIATCVKVCDSFNCAVMHLSA